MEDTNFAPATPGDLTAIRALLDRCALPTDDLHEDHLERFLVCRVGGRLAGTVGLELLGEVALLRSLAVAPELRGRTLAHQLWTRVREEARRHGIQRLYLLTTTADGLFARWGFRPIARDDVPVVVRATTEYSALCSSTATVMALDLTTASDQRG